MLRTTLVALSLCACGHTSTPQSSGLLQVVADVPLPGGSTRFDYQDIDAQDGLLVVAHMNDNSVLLLSLADGSVKKVLPNIPTPRGVAVAPEIHRIFVTSTPSKLVIIDSSTLAEVARVATGASPDGDAWDADDQIVAVSDQGDGALSLIAAAGTGTRTQVPLGSETGNVVYDARQKQFWITVVVSGRPNELVEVDPKTSTITMRIPLPGCSGAHGLRLHPDGQSAFIACEDNDKLARVDLGGTHAVVTAATGAGPDVLSVDAEQGWLYVAAESGDVTIWDLDQPGVALVGHEVPGAGAHTVAADPATHRVFFPLTSGPILRIMQPTS
ncbi:MAG TPA: hypothetical protein VL326_23115 [Kofleriaceae bacterium]|nr:hypothetical protein [Kofleriaceae bacterium]